MKAMVYKAYGPPSVVKAAEVEKPVPGDDQVLIRIHATTVTSGDMRLRSLNVPTGFGLLLRLAAGLTRPRNGVLGTEFAGIVEAVGHKVTQFKPGDHVFGANAGMRCHAQYTVMPQDGAIAPKPETLSFEEAAAIPFGALSSLVFLRDCGKLEAGQKVLINGASGCLGVYGVQLAKYLGAHVTGVCSGANASLVASLGADNVVDYTQEDFTQHLDTYDLIYETLGKVPFSRNRNALKSTGRAIHAAASLPELFSMFAASIGRERKAAGGMVVFKQKDLNFIVDRINEGSLKPVIDSCYPFEHMAEAHQRVDSGRKKGSVVVTVPQD